jgi:hypothetical protein
MNLSQGTSNLLVSSSSSSNLTNFNDISFPFRKWPRRNIGCLSVMPLFLILNHKGLKERSKAVPIPTVPIQNLTIHPEYLNWLPNNTAPIKIRQTSWRCYSTCVEHKTVIAILPKFSYEKTINRRELRDAERYKNVSVTKFIKTYGTIIPAVISSQQLNANEL